MSIVANYARINESDLELFCSEPEKLYTNAAEVIDIDRSWDPMAWLVSECKREEHAYNQLVLRSMMSKRKPETEKKTNFFRKLFKKDNEEDNIGYLKEEQKKLEKYPPEIILIGIEGRGETKEERIDFGYGESCIFKGEELKNIVAAFNNCNALENKPNYQEMDEKDVFPQCWQEEADDLYQNYIVANFNKLKSLYSNALSHNQIVIMWYS